MLYFMIHNFFLKKYFRFFSLRLIKLLKTSWNLISNCLWQTNYTIYLYFTVALELDSLFHLVVHDLAVGLHQALSIKGSLPVQHLVHAHPQTPPVALRAVTALACRGSSKNKGQKGAGGCRKGIKIKLKYNYTKGVKVTHIDFGTLWGKLQTNQR